MCFKPQMSELRLNLKKKKKKKEEGIFAVCSGMGTSEGQQRADVTSVPLSEGTAPSRAGSFCPLANRALLFPESLQGQGLFQVLFQPSTRRSSALPQGSHSRGGLLSLSPQVRSGGGSSAAGLRAELRSSGQALEAFPRSQTLQGPCGKAQLC